MLERDLDEHAGELAPAPRALADRPRQRGLLALTAEAIGERIAGEHERIALRRRGRARDLTASSTFSKRAHAIGRMSWMRAQIHSRKWT